MIRLSLTLFLVFQASISFACDFQINKPDPSTLSDKELATETKEYLFRVYRRVRCESVDVLDQKDFLSARDMYFKSEPQKCTAAIEEVFNNWPRAALSEREYYRLSSFCLSADSNKLSHLVSLLTDELAASGKFDPDLFKENINAWVAHDHWGCELIKDRFTLDHPRHDQMYEQCQNDLLRSRLMDLSRWLAPDDLEGQSPQTFNELKNIESF